MSDLGAQDADWSDLSDEDQDVDDEELEEWEDEDNAELLDMEDMFSDDEEGMESDDSAMSLPEVGEQAVRSSTVAKSCAMCASCSVLHSATHARQPCS